MASTIGNGPLRMAIVGPGSQGLLWAAYLQPCYHVCLVGRLGMLPFDRYFRLTEPEGRERSLQLPCRPPDNLPWPPDLVIFTTKIQNLAPALRGLIPAIPPQTPLLFFQNGLGPQLDLAGKNPNRPILAASTTEGAYRPQPDGVVHAGRGETWLGGLTEPGKRWETRMKAILARSGMETDIAPDIEQRLWHKLAVNAGINPFTALLSCRNGEILANAEFNNRLPDLCAEFVAVAAAHGRAFNAQDLAADIRRVAGNTAANQSSMLQDILAGKATEIDHINGFIARDGERLGIPTPVNRALTLAVKTLSGNNSRARGGPDINPIR